mgnify:CR=1|jgi:hypothetical protein
MPMAFILYRVDRKEGYEKEKLFRIEFSIIP